MMVPGDRAILCSEELQGEILLLRTEVTGQTLSSIEQDFTRSLLVVVYDTNSVGSAREFTLT